MHQPIAPTQTLEVAQLPDPIGREHQRRQIRYLLRNPPVHGLYPISGAE